MPRLRKWVLRGNLNRMPTQSDFRMEESEAPGLNEGDILVETLYVSVDIGSVLAKVVRSRNSKYPPGCHVVSYSGLVDGAVIPKAVADMPEPLSVSIVDDIKGLHMSLHLGCLGLAGLSAYFGLTRILEAKAGETIVINGASGAVGSVVGQIAKIIGCTKVIGITGSTEKSEWLKSIGFDHALIYGGLASTLRRVAPEGVHCFFDNMGVSPSSNTVIAHMNSRGRIAVCGAISGYIEDMPPSAMMVQPLLIRKELRMEGFSVNRWDAEERKAAVERLAEWVEQGKLLYRQTILDGFTNIPTAILDMVKGDNIGKLLVNCNC